MKVKYNVEYEYNVCKSIKENIEIEDRIWREKFSKIAVVRLIDSLNIKNFCDTVVVPEENNEKHDIWAKYRKMKTIVCEKSFHR